LPTHGVVWPPRMFGAALLQRDQTDFASRFGTVFDAAVMAAGDGQGLAVGRKGQRQCRHVEVGDEGLLHFPALSIPKDDLKPPLVLLLLNAAASFGSGASSASAIAGCLFQPSVTARASPPPPFTPGDAACTPPPTRPASCLSASLPHPSAPRSNCLSHQAWSCGCPRMPTWPGSGSCLSRRKGNVPVRF
jgi:hypothetical protein